jgi:hypothetical protein
MTKRAATNIILTLGMFLLLYNLALSQDGVYFNLHVEMIESISINRQDKYWTVGVRLTEEHKKQYEKLTENNIGKSLILVSGNRELSSTIIKAKVGSGTLVFSYLESPEKAIYFVKELLSPSNQ